MNRFALAAALASALVSHVVWAEPSVDVDDLPSLPAATDDQSSQATMLAAASAEEDVVVGADKREQSLGNVASAVTVISGDRIRRFGYRNVSEALAAVAGVYTADTRIVNGIGIRGLDIPGDFNTRILVLVDGASVNESWGSFAGVGFDSFIAMDDISRIELIRGPVSSVYGTNAFFSIVNIVTRGASETPHLWGRTSINSINGSISSAGFAEGTVGRGVRGTVQAMERIGETLSVPNVGPNLTGDGAHQFAVSLAGSYDGSFAQVRAFQNERDSPFAPYSGDATAPSPYQLVNTQVMAEAGHTWQLGKQLSVTARVYANLYQFYDHIIQDPALVPALPGIGVPPFDDYGEGRQYGSEIRGRYEIIPQKLGVTAGVEGDYDRTVSHSFTEGDTTGSDAVQPIQRDFNIEGAYAEVDGQPFEHVGFTAGARYDRNSAINQNVSPRAALFLSQEERYGLKLLFAQGFRNPSAYEAFFTDGVSFAAAHDLQAERITSYEAVAWVKPTPGLSLRLSGFYWDASGIVEELPDPNTNDNGCMSCLQFRNVGEYVTEGFEFEGSYRNSAGWYAFGGGTYAHVGSTDLPDGTESATGVVFGDVVNAPAWTGGGGVSTPKLGGLAHLSVEARYIGDRVVRDDQTTTPETRLPDAPGWVGLNANIYIPNIRGFDLTIGVRNLIGTRDTVVAPADYDRVDQNGVRPTITIPTVPGEGREFFAKLGYSY